MIEVKITPENINALANQLFKTAEEIVSARDFAPGEDILRFTADGATRDTSSLVRSGSLFMKGRRRIRTSWMYQRTISKYGPARDKSYAEKYPDVPTNVDTEGLMVVVWGTPYAYLEDKRSGFFSRLKSAEGLYLVQTQFLEYINKKVIESGLSG